MKKESKAVLSKLSGPSFRDKDGRRWRVKGRRPGPEGQLVIEAEMRGNYPRIAVDTMTEAEFLERARVAPLRPERAGRTGHRDKR